MQISDQAQIKRLQGGSIDYRYYSQRGCRLRNKLLRGFLQSLWRLPSKLIDGNRPGTRKLLSNKPRVQLVHREQA